MTESITTQHEEVLWANRVPFMAAAKVGKVHLLAEGGLLTLCGLKPGSPRQQFVPTPADARCTRCAAKAAR